MDVGAASYNILHRAPTIEDPRLADLLAYWSGKRHGRPMPAYGDIDPVEIPALLTYIWIHDYDPATDRFRCRLMGEAVRAAYSSRVVGLDVEQIVTPAAYPVVAERYRAVLSIPAVGHGTGRIYGHTIGRVGSGERLYLPLADAEGRPCMIVGGTVYRLWSDVPGQDDPDVELRPDTMTPLADLSSDQADQSTT